MPTAHDGGATGDGRSIGVVGLGSGTVAAWMRAGDRLTFYEIDPLVIRVAEDPAYFTWLADAAIRPDIVVGDARLSLEPVAAGSYDLLVLDAFSSDAVPAHLLTAEAIADDARVLRPDGMLAFHVSNRYYDLAPAVASAARQAGLTVLQRIYTPSEADARLGATISHWLIATTGAGRRAGTARGRLGADPGRRGAADRRPPRPAPPPAGGSLVGQVNGTHTSAAINQLMSAAHAISMSRCRSVWGSHQRVLAARTSQRPSMT